MRAQDDWRQRTIADIQDHFEQEIYAPNMAEVMGEMARRSQVARTEADFTPFRYGPGLAEDGYWLASAEPSAEIVVFVHGGAWRGGSAETYLHAGPWITQAGYHYVSLNFGNALDFEGRLFPMWEQLVRALSWVIRQAERRGALARVHLVGHSSGAHLSSCLACLDWSTLIPEHPAALRSVTLISGVYELEPVRHSRRRAYLRLEDNEVYALSALRHNWSSQVPVTVACGDQESPEFMRQARVLAAKLRRAQVPVHEALLPGINHFEIAASLADPESDMAKLVLATWRGRAAVERGGA